MWTCHMCTFENPVSVSCCDVCGTRRPVTPVTVQAEPQLPPASSIVLTSASVIAVQNLMQKRNRPSDLPQRPAILMTVDSINDFCKGNKSHFVDDSFPPAPKSLYLGDYKSAAVANKFKVHQWLKLDEIRSVEGARANWTVIKNPSPSDIEQGALGNCWFLSALALVAEREDLLQNILVTKEFNPLGVYAIRLCKNGQWTEIVVDDIFPCDIYRRLVFSKAKRNQLWVPLIEKAMAKLFGCYEALVAGHSTEAMRVLTGFPCDVIRMNATEFDSDITWARLHSCQEAGFLIGAACGTASVGYYDAEFKKLGLVSLHCYSILNVFQLNDLRLLQLRNPWGHFAWNGDWSDKSRLWTRDLIKKLNPTKSRDGIFWMSYNDFLKYFYTIDICKTRHGWLYRHQNGLFLPYADQANHPCYLIHVEQTTEIEFTIYQESTRTKNSSNNTRSTDMALLLFETTPNLNLKRLVGYSERKISCNIGFETILHPGSYLLVPMAFQHWTDQDENMTYPEFVLAMHSAYRIVCDRLPVSPPYLLADCVIALALQHAEPLMIYENIYTYALGPQVNWHGTVIVIENRYKTKNIIVKSCCEGSVNLIPTRGNLVTVDCVPPNHRQVLQVLSPVDSMVGYVSSNYLQYYMTNKPGLKNWGPPGINHQPMLTSREGLHAPRPI